MTDLTSLATTIDNTIKITPQSQLRERLTIISSWFGTLNTAQNALQNKVVLELGCGQGDMTVTLAGLLQSQESKIIAVDPASLDYGAPLTLGQAQAKISEMELGKVIDWVKAEPLEYLASSLLTGEGSMKVQPDFVVLAHSLFYLPSETYLLRLLSLFRNQSKTLLLAEWGMRASHSGAEVHVLAAEVQALAPIPEGNIVTLFMPERVKEIVEEAGWECVREGWVTPDEDVEDGKWEVEMTMEMSREGMPEQAKGLLNKLEQTVGKLNGSRVRSMDVWTGVFNAPA